MRILYLFLVLFLFSCHDNRITSEYEKWYNRKIMLPSDILFTTDMNDTITFPLEKSYKILTHVDSTGCVSCRLMLNH